MNNYEPFYTCELFSIYAWKPKPQMIRKQMSTLYFDYPTNIFVKNKVQFQSYFTLFYNDFKN